MPWAKFMIEPVYLCRKPLPPDKSTCYEFEALANNKLSGVIRQLSSLACASGQLFDEITEECLQITLRTTALTDRIKSLADRVSKLDAKSVKVGAGLGIIVEGAVRRKHLTISSSRPDAAVNSSTDAPVTQDEHLVPVDVSGVTFQRLSSFRRSLIHRDFVIKRSKPDRNRSTSKDRSCRRRNTVSLGRDFTRKSKRNVDYLRDPERRRSASEFPVDKVPDTTDEGIQTDPPDESVIYGTGRVIDLAGKRDKSLHSIYSETLRRLTDVTLSHSETDVKSGVRPVKRSNDFTRSFASSSSPTPVSLLDRLTGRCIFMTNNSLEARVKDAATNVSSSSSSAAGASTSVSASASASASTSTSAAAAACRRIRLRAESSSPSDDEHILPNDHVNDQLNKTPVQLRQGVSTYPDERNRGKLCHEDGRSSSGNWSASSSQSNADSDTGLANSTVNAIVQTVSRVKYNNSGIPACVLNESNQLTDSGYHFSRSPSDHSVDDKESFISDSLIAHPTDSEQNTNGYTSDTSAMSGFSSIKSPSEEVRDVTNVAEVTRRHPRAGSKKVANVQYANRDSESWLQYFDQESSSMSESTVTPTADSSQNLSDTDTIKGTNSTATNLSRRSSVNDRSTVTGGEEGHSQCGLDEAIEEAESVHSMDTDGYYTSMHTDSGVMRAGKPVQLLLTPYSSFRGKNNKRASIASTGTIGDISINSLLSNSDIDGSGSSTPVATHRMNGASGGGSVDKVTSRLFLKKCTQRKIAPLPPPRASLCTRTTPKDSLSCVSMNSLNSASSKSSNLSMLHVRTQLELRDSHSPSPHATASESEASECRARRKEKTTIDSSKYPSLCVVTTSEGSDLASSDDEGGFDHRDNQGEWDLARSQTPEHPLPPPLKGFKIKHLFSMKPLDALSKTISKSRESIEGKIRRSFGVPSPTSSTSSKKHSPPKSKQSKPKFRQTSLLSSPQTGTGLFFTRHADVDKVTKSVDSGTRSTEVDPFSRLFPTRHINSVSPDTRLPLKASSTSLRRPGSLSLTDSAKRSAYEFTSSQASDSPVCSSPHTDDDSTPDYLQEILSLSSSPRKISTVDRVSHSAPVTPAVATLAERKAELFKKRSPPAPEVSRATASSTSPGTGKKCLLTTDQLLQLIYSSAKAANVKTDVECGLTSGEVNSEVGQRRSVTPNGVTGEETAGETLHRRSSWAGGPSSTAYLNLSPRRSSIATDDVTSLSTFTSSSSPPASRSTTMDHFIRLISAKSTQISINSPNSPPRKSAAELLRVSPCSDVEGDVNGQSPVSPVSPGNRRPPMPPSKTRVINGRVYRAPYRLETMYPTIEELTEDTAAHKSTEKLHKQVSANTCS